MATLKEKDIVDHLIRNWNTYFKNEELHFYKTEYTVTSDWRTDILAYVISQHPYNIERTYKVPIFIEVKYNNFRDLVYELEKGLAFINRKNNNPDFPRYLAVIVNDTIDEVTLAYIKEKNIPIYMYSVDNEDLTTFKVSMFDY